MDKFETNKLYIPKTKRLKSFKHIDHVYEIIRPKVKGKLKNIIK